MLYRLIYRLYSVNSMFVHPDFFISQRTGWLRAEIRLVFLDFISLRLGKKLYFAFFYFCRPEGARAFGRTLVDKVAGLLPGRASDRVSPGGL